MPETLDITKRNSTLEFKIEGESVLQCETMEYQGNTSVNWSPNVSKPINSFYERLIHFYNELRQGNYRGLLDKPLMFTVSTTDDLTRFLFPDEDKSHVPVFKENPLREELVSLLNWVIFHTPWADFGMRDPRLPTSLRFPLQNTDGLIWTPQNGRLYAISSQDITGPLSKLISSTANFDMSPDDLAAHLKPYFSFNTQQTSQS